MSTWSQREGATVLARAATRAGGAAWARGDDESLEAYVSRLQIAASLPAPQCAELLAGARAATDQSVPVIGFSLSLSFFLQYSADLSSICLFQIVIGPLQDSRYAAFLAALVPLVHQFEQIEAENAAKRGFNGLDASDDNEEGEESEDPDEAVLRPKSTAAKKTKKKNKKASNASSSVEMDDLKSEKSKKKKKKKPKQNDWLLLYVELWDFLLRFIFNFSWTSFPISNEKCTCNCNQNSNCSKSSHLLLLDQNQNQKSKSKSKSKQKLEFVWKCFSKQRCGSFYDLLGSTITQITSDQAKSSSGSRRFANCVKDRNAIWKRNTFIRLI